MNFPNCSCIRPPQLFHPSLQSLFDQTINYLHPKACFVTCTNFSLNQHNGFEERETINGIQKDRNQFDFSCMCVYTCECNRSWLIVNFVVFCLHPKACIVTCTNFGLNRHNGFEEREMINDIQKDRNQFVNY